MAGQILPPRSHGRQSRAAPPHLPRWFTSRDDPQPPPPGERRRHKSLDEPSLSSLPDDLLLECLSRVPTSSLPSLSVVCRRFSTLLDSPDFFLRRRSHGLLRRTFLALSISEAGLLVLSSSGDPPLAGAAWTILPLPAGLSDGGSFSFSFCRFVPVGRSKFAAAAIGGKIYVAGGSTQTSAVEEYDPATNAWKVVSEAPRRRYGCLGAAADGVFFVIGGLKVAGRGEARVDAYTYAGTMDLYDVQRRAWRRARAVPGGGCVVAACAAGDIVYALASHAVEVSFWRWEGGTAAKGGGGWARLPPPPVPPLARVARAGRFACIGFGASTVVLLVHISGLHVSASGRARWSCWCTSPVGGAGDRRGASRSCDRERLLLVYDAVTGEWFPGAALPPALSRVACVCVDC
ncbi:unnamed protein product [Spirodela intermedia]|uniref:F-box domain-containing protein n=1 Tax=Spirodela intermedia TaxID=51605 RepID=A0A7I8JGR7_SPIIN|nr:unnamed protein product [Spirodela intermedia]CAA6669141.1 unnamed protein product [Spirodela intermedia]